MSSTARVGHIVNNNCEYHDDRGSNKRCFCGLFALNTEPKIDDDGTRDAVDAVVAVAPEPDRSTAAHHATAVSTGPTTRRTHDRVWALSTTSTPTPSTPTPSNAGKPTAQHISNCVLLGAKPHPSRQTSSLRRPRLRRPRLLVQTL